MRSKTLPLAFLTVALLLSIFPSLPVIPTVRGVGTWNGQNTIHVPMSWCALQGSPAQANPNVAGDTSTDAILWRRHERPTDNIYSNPAGITLRSAINSIWGTGLNFPVIADPATTLGVVGDVKDPYSVNPADFTEFNNIINECQTAWNNLATSGNGVAALTAVNIDLYTDGSGTYEGVIGYGGCTKSVSTNVCTAPYDGLVVVIDNHYLYPGIAPDTFPGTNLHFPVKDQVDQLVGHEVGHALGLNHRTDTTTALMYPSQQVNVGPYVDNIALNAAEVTTVRASALIVPGVQQDPLGTILNGQFVAARRTSSLNSSLPSYLDLSTVKVTLDTGQNTASFTQQLFGLIPKMSTALQYWTLVNADNDTNTGANSTQLSAIGVPSTNFKGAELAIKTEVTNLTLTGTAWQYEGGALVPISGVPKTDLASMVVHAYYAAGYKANLTLVSGVPVYDLISTTIPKVYTHVDIGKPLSIQAITLAKGAAVSDKLDLSLQERGSGLLIDYPSFAQCFPQGNGVPGQSVPVELEGLKPNAPIHGLLGPRPVFTGTTNATGGALIPFPIPGNATLGLHLVTIGVNDTALTADCELNVVQSTPTIPFDTAALAVTMLVIVIAVWRARKPLRLRKMKSPA